MVTSLTCRQILGTHCSLLCAAPQLPPYSPTALCPQLQQERISSSSGMELKIIKDLEESFLSCKICEEEAQKNGVELQLLPCQHSLCSKCISEMVNRRGAAPALVCPFCREECFLPESGKFPRFRYAEELSDFMKNYVSDNVQKQVEDKPKLEGDEILKPILLHRFVYILPDLVWLCWGKCGKLYATNGAKRNILDDRGLSYINIFRGESRRFGHLKCSYKRGLFVDEQFFVYNYTRSSIEVYTNEILVRSWRTDRVGRVMWMVRHPVLGILVRYDTYHNGLVQKTLMHYSCSGQPISISTKEPVCNQSLDRILRCQVLSAYHGSIWLMDYGESYLYEIPVTCVGTQMVYKEAIRHCKLKKIVLGCVWGEHKILFRRQDSSNIEMLDLLEEHNLQHKSRRRRRSYKTPEIDCRAKTLLSDITAGVTKMTASEDGFVALLGEDAILEIYQTESGNIEMKDDVSLEELEFIGGEIPVPDYPERFTDVTNRKICLCMAGLCCYLFFTNPDLFKNLGSYRLYILKNVLKKIVYMLSMIMYMRVETLRKIICLSIGGIIMLPNFHRLKFYTF